MGTNDIDHASCILITKFNRFKLDNIDSSCMREHKLIQYQLRLRRENFAWRLVDGKVPILNIDAEFTIYRNRVAVRVHDVSNINALRNIKDEIWPNIQTTLI